MRLDILLGHFLFEVVSVSNDVCDGGVVAVELHLASTSQNDVFEGVARHFGAEIEL